MTRADRARGETDRLLDEEAPHHRGPIMIYLRLTGIVPPRINDYP